MLKRLCIVWCAGSQALPSEAARGVVLQAAQAFFQSASSLEAEEIGLGQITLGLLPHDHEVQQQGTCLQALQELQDYGLQVLPAHYNQVCFPPLLPWTSPQTLFTPLPSPVAHLSANPLHAFPPPSQPFHNVTLHH